MNEVTSNVIVLDTYKKKEDNEFSERLQRICKSLEKINATMEELKTLTNRNKNATN